jgi:hypothetical protein
VAGPGLQHRHARRHQPGLEAGLRGQWQGQRRAPRNLPVGAPAARQGDDRPVGHRRAHLLAAQRLPGRPARRDDLGAQLHPAGQALLHGDALQADALLRERPGGA